MASESEEAEDFLEDDQEKPEDILSLKDAGKVLSERCKDAGISCTLITNEEGNLSIRIDISNGRKTRPITIENVERANAFLSVPFEEFVFVGNYKGICSYESGTIEAGVISAIPLPMGSVLMQLGIRSDKGVVGHTAPIRLKSETGDDRLEVELGPTTDTMNVLANARGVGLSLKIRGVTFGQHDRALSILEKIADSVFYQLGLTRGVQLQLVRERRRDVVTKQRDRVDLGSVRFLRMQYPHEAMSLYFYAVSARGKPLLQFLAFYQCIEFFFPIYSLGEAKKVIGNMVKDERFDPYNDKDLARLLNAVKINQTKGYGDERSQLRATLQACLSTESIRDFLSNDEDRIHFFTKRAKSSGAHPILISDKGEDKSDFRDAVAARIYDIRCKIVHTKADGGTDDREVLLPFSEGADLLEYDIELIQFVAQQVLTTNSASFHL